MKTYIIVGDNNHWYRTITCTEAAAREEMEALKANIVREVETDNAAGELYLYEAVEVARLEIPE